MKEIEIVQMLNSWGIGTWIDDFTIFLSSMTFLLILWSVLIIGSAYFDKRNRRKIILSMLVMAVLTYFISEILFKGALIYIFDPRTRPFLAAPELIKPLGKMWMDSSFPSTHMASTTAILTVFIYYYRKTLVPATIFILLMAFSRMHNGMHYPSDVIAGTALGIIIGATAIYLAQRAIKEKNYKTKANTSEKRRRLKHAGSKK
jgi:undecaprenyl-diphosphatase